MSKTYYPAKTFDDDCSALADHFARKKWSFSGVSDTKALIKDAVEQRAERKAFDDATIAFEGLKQRFGEKQHGERVKERDQRSEGTQHVR